MTTTRGIEHEDLWAIPRPSDPQLSPDGERVAFTVTTPTRDTDGYESSIWEVRADGSAPPRRLTHGRLDSSPRWSPDGTHLAFLRSRGAGDPPQIYVLPLDGGDARRLTRRPAGAGVPVWSPDGSLLAFAAAVIPEVDGGEPLSVERLGYKADGVGLIRGATHLFVARRSDGDLTQLTFGPHSAAGPVWSPDGDRLAYSASAGRDRDLEIVSVVYAIDREGGRPQPLSPADGLYKVADWSPDGSELLVVGQTRLRAGHDLLHALPATGGEPRPLLAGYDRNVMPGAPGYPGSSPRYRAAGDRIYFCARDRGCVHVLSIPAEGGEPEVVVGGKRVVGGLSAVGDRLAFLAASPRSPGEIWVGEQKLTAFFDEALPDVALHEPEEVRFSAPDGLEIQGWMIRSGDAHGPTPLLLDVHGGPHNAWGPVFDGAHLYHQTLAQAGWTVLILNPRGSDGYGEGFWTGVVGGWGKADEADFMAGVDHLISRGLADPDRLAVTGYSYGGYMSCWLPSRSTRFKAAVVGGGICNLVSLAGTSDLGRHLAGIELEAPVADAVDGLLELSPITRVASVQTPTLILHGEDDDRCPVSQAEEWLGGLRDQRVPVEMVRYPAAGHLFVLNGRPSHRIDYGRRVADWVTSYTNGGRRPGLRPRRADLQQRLTDLIDRHKVPGASLAVLAGGHVTEAAAGLLNTRTGFAATPDSLWQIGSITKVYTATLVMQLAEEGRLDLDAPVVEVLPELRLGDPDATKQVTPRHLLSHTSGIPGDLFLDTGRGDDCLARYVAACEDLTLSHPLGATMSYCNSGYKIAGRIIEQLTDQVWDQALADRLIKPLGMTRTMTLPEEVIRFAAAIGHAGQPAVPVDTWILPRSSGPAGLISATAADVVAFARMHMDGGAGVLSGASVRAMQEPQVVMPDPYTLGTHWGLGWILFEWNKKVYGHDGSTIGQGAFLRVVPDEGVAIALLTNGGNAADLYRDLYGGLLEELAGVTMPERPGPPATPPDVNLDEHVGSYERVGNRIEITRQDDHLVAKVTVTGELASLLPAPTVEYDLRPVNQDLFVTRPPGARTWTPMTFYRLPDGSPYVHFGVRATPKLT